MIIYSKKIILSEQMLEYWLEFVTDKDFLNVKKLITITITFEFITITIKFQSITFLLLFIALLHLLH